MKYILALLILCEWSLAFILNGTSILEGNGSEFTETEKEMIRNVIEDSEGSKRAIFLSNMETSCLDFSCEMYDLNDVEDHLI